MLKVELNAADNTCTERTANGKTFYEQRAYLHTGSAYPVPFKLSHQNPSQAYPSGFYEIDPESFKVNQYGGLEVDRYNFKLTPLKQPTPAAKAS